MNLFAFIYGPHVSPKDATKIYHFLSNKHLRLLPGTISKSYEILPLSVIFPVELRYFAFGLSFAYEMALLFFSLA